MSSLINHVKLSLKKTNEYTSKISDEILKMPGMSGKKTRHFYNNICSMDGAKYLEIGTWKGSSFCSAMCNNSMTDCVGIDNWSEPFSRHRTGPKRPKITFLKNFKKYKGKNNATFIEKNCWNVDVETIGKFNIYLYDGDHKKGSHTKALCHFYDCLDDEFIYLVDDWNWQKVRSGTMKGIKNTDLKILYQKEIRTPKNNEWHNGISIFVLKKKN